MVDTPSKPAGERLGGLSPRQLQYVLLVCRKEEPTRDQIADIMGCAPNTVENHRAAVYLKWDVHTRTEMLYKAVELGIVKCPCGGTGTTHTPKATGPEV